MRNKIKVNVKELNKELTWEFRRGLFIGALFMLALCLLLSMLTFDFQKEEVSTQEKDVGFQEIVNNCANKTILESAECVNAHIRQFFYYNISNLNKELDFDKLRQEGGVCSSWAGIFCALGDELGFYTQIISMKTGYINITKNNETKEYVKRHENCLWSDEHFWIILDQESLFKFKFGKSNWTINIT